MSANVDFDAIVVGSGITGGWAAKELTEKGLKVLMIERGRHIEHGDYPTETVPVWDMPYRGYGDPALYKSDYAMQTLGVGFNEWTQAHFVNDREHPYQTTGDEFIWNRSYQLGGRSLVWGRQSYRMSAIDFEANKRDGHGCDWPIRYEDLAPWYDYVEEFVGIHGENVGCPTLPDGRFQPHVELNPVEKLLRSRLKERYPDRYLTSWRSANLTEAKDARGPCQFRGHCARGCSFGAYFSTQSSTLPAARATGNLTLLTDSLVQTLEYDPATRRVTGVKVMNTKTKAGATYRSKILVMCASTFNTIAILLKSASEAAPNGLANSSGTLGRYIMDHVSGDRPAVGATAIVDGFQDITIKGNRPGPGLIIPRFTNVGTPETETDFLRGYMLVGAATRANWRAFERQPGLGAAFKARVRKPGAWVIRLGATGETLPHADNRVTIDWNRRDSEGSPQIRVTYENRQNEFKMMEHAGKEAAAILGLIGQVTTSNGVPGPGGSTTHEMGGARMGRDPKISVLNGYNQAWDVPNLFVTDGAAMSSSGCTNPSLNYMALTARACDAAVSMLKSGAI